MPRTSDDDLEQFLADVQRRQRNTPHPVRMAEVISRLMSRRGYAQIQQSQDFTRVWNDLVGETLAANSRVGRLTRGVLEVVVNNSAALQELTFQKRGLLQKLQAQLNDQPIKDLRFRIGAIG